MPLVDDLEVWGDDARRALAPGEALLAITSVGVAYGARGGAEPDFWTTPAGRLADRVNRAVPEPKGWVGKALAGVGGVAFASPSVDLPSDFPESWIGGRTCFGPAGSSARQLEAVATGHSFFAVTAQRVVALVDVDDRMRVTWAMPRDAVVAARRRPRLLARGRFGLVFADGSWIVLGTFGSHVGSAHAKRVVAALTAGS
ncbi:hypothetical protein [Saccharothrix texasensis]|uniref:Uncharacterized protein n=1 Tax=Saccharothrix texasensis TaxID=103734 RepID=A0A3N1H4S0_9PSEU|nr:hypothetical protein [Saccharothrix texasensis]ROP37478.1 hypothetical protein EDD40_2791 [Saccharothrix texasensis]